jgi:hypothetical protein
VNHVAIDATGTTANSHTNAAVTAAWCWHTHVTESAGLIAPPIKPLILGA